MKLIEVKKLLHIEGFSKKRVKWLTQKITDDGLWKIPICIEKSHLLVLNGQHRLETAKGLGFKFIPCALFNYDDVEMWSLRSNHEVTRALVIERSINGDIYPYKTVKHRFPIDIEACNLSFEELIG